MVVAGAGAAGMMCAIEAGKRGRRVLVLDHAQAPGEKIRISGGGRCNFTNLRTAPEAFLSRNPRFCISALRRYRPADEPDPTVPEPDRTVPEPETVVPAV